MMELLENDFVNSHSLYDNLDDFDSGCSCLPSSPSNCSEFSCSSLDNFGENWTIKREDAIEMGRSFLEGGPVLNPYINIKADNDINECDNRTALLMADNFSDLLGDAIIIEEPLEDLHKDDTVLDKNFNEAALDISDPNIVNVVQDCLKPQPTVKEQSRKRKHSESDHTYASNQECQFENAPVQKQKSASTSNLKASKDDKYWEKRQKNNLAAKRSRQIKRNKEIELVKKSNSLEKENADLVKQMERLKKLVHKLELKLAR